MIVALVGCDCSGKSTCFNKIDKSLGIFIKGRQIDNLNAQILSDIKKMAESDHLFVFDRIPIVDDFVYAPIFNKGRMSDLLWMIDEVREIAKKCTFIYFTCPNDVLFKRMSERKDEFVDQGDIETIVKNYGVTFELLNVTPVKVSTHLLNEEQTLKKVTEVIKCKLQK